MLVHSRPFVRSIQWLSGYKRLDVKQKCLICCCRNIQSIVIRNTFISRHFGPLAWSETRHSVTLWSQVRRRKLAATWPRYVGHRRQAEVLSELSVAPFRLKIWTGVSVDCHRRQGNVCSVKSIHRPLIAWLLLWCEFKSLRPSDAYMHEQFYHHWFRQWLVAWSAPSHYLKQCWDIVNRTLRKKLQWNFKRNTYIFFQGNPFENVARKWRLFCLSLNTLTHCPHMATNIMPKMGLHKSWNLICEAPGYNFTMNSQTTVLCNEIENYTNTNKSNDTSLGSLGAKMSQTLGQTFYCSCDATPILFQTGFFVAERLMHI